MIICLMQIKYQNLFSDHSWPGNIHSLIQTEGNDQMLEVDPCSRNIYNNQTGGNDKILEADPAIHNIDPLIHSIYHCDFCGKAFSQRKRLNRHLKIHTGPRDYICKFCNKTFYRKDHLRGHIVRTHVDMLKSSASDVQE